MRQPRVDARFLKKSSRTKTPSRRHQRRSLIAREPPIDAAGNKAKRYDKPGKQQEALYSGSAGCSFKLRRKERQGENAWPHPENGSKQKIAYADVRSAGHHIDD